MVYIYYFFLLTLSTTPPLRSITFTFSIYYILFLDITLYIYNQVPYLLIYTYFRRWISSIYVYKEVRPLIVSSLFILGTFFSYRTNFFTRNCRIVFFFSKSFGNVMLYRISVFFNLPKIWHFFRILTFFVAGVLGEWELVF